jgi:hypothetical protein
MLDGPQYGHLFAVDAEHQHRQRRLLCAQPGSEHQANAIASDGVVINQQHPDDGFRLDGLLRAASAS